MDIFNRKKVAELEKKLHEAELDRDRYMGIAGELTMKFEAISEFEESVPEDCERGPWCKACEFVRTFHHIEHYGYGSYSSTIGYVCGKGKSCQHFVQKEAEE